MMPVRHAYMFLLSVVAAALCSCSKADVDVVDACGKEIVFSFDSLDISVDGTKADVTTLSTLNVKCVYGGSSWKEKWSLSGATVSSGKIRTGKYWPASGDYTSMGGYHFAVTNASAMYISGAFVYIDVRASSGVDVVAGASVSPTYGSSVSIACKHVFAKLGDVTVTPAISGYSISDLTLTMSGIGDHIGYNITDDQRWVNSTMDWTIASRSAAFTSYTATDYKGCYLSTNTCTLSATYTVAKGSYTYTQSTPVTTTASFANGVTSNLNIKLPVVEQSDLTFSVTVNPTVWSTGSIYNETM